MNDDVKKMMLEDSTDLLDNVEVTDIATQCQKLKHLQDQIEEQEKVLEGIKEKAKVNAGLEILKLEGNGLVLVGHDKGGFTPNEIAKFANGLPLISEDPLSFSKAITGASIFLADEEIRKCLKPDYVVVIGRTTLSRSINSFINLAPFQYVIDKRIENIDTARVATKKFRSEEHTSELQSH